MKGKEFSKMKGKEFSKRTDAIFKEIRKRSDVLVPDSDSVFLAKAIIDSNLLIAEVLMGIKDELEKHREE